MTNEQFLTRLKRALGGLEREARDEILDEIRSHAEDMNPGDSLAARFGSPEELAAQYLDGDSPPPRLSQRVTRVGRKVLLGVGIVTGAIVVALVVVIWAVSGDDFNYADESAPELTENPENWSSVEWLAPRRIRVDQARVVIYWHEGDALRWNCEGQRHNLQTSRSPLEIRHNACLLYVPVGEIQIEARQGSLVLVRPRGAVDVDIMQSNLRIAPNDTRLKYQFDSSRSDVASFESDDGAPNTLSIKARESSVELYEY